ncbi:MAG: hypothetical protein ACQESR_07925 [Planctomycetota bacterium]
MESCSTQHVLPLVGLAADQVIRDRYKKLPRDENAAPPGVDFSSRPP